MQHLLYFVATVAGLLVFPEALGLGSYVVEVLIGIGLFVVVTPVAVYHAILKSLPEEMPMMFATEPEIPVELNEHLAAYEALGFQRAGNPIRLQLQQEVLLVAMNQPDEGMIATVYRIAAPKPKIAYDVVSFFDAPNCSLTTGMDHGAGVLPAGPAVLRQVFQDASPDELVQRHRTAMRFLRQQRLPPIDVSPSAIPSLLKLSFQINRETFLKAKVGNTFTALWRTISQHNPHMGELHQQTGIEDRIGRIPRRKRVARAKATAERV